MHRIDHPSLKHWQFPTAEEAEKTAASWNLPARLVIPDTDEKDFAVFTRDGQRAQGWPTYDHEPEAQAAVYGYREMYGMWVGRICNDHPAHPRESCPEPHAEIDY